MASLASEGEAPAGEAPHGEAPAGEATHGEAAPGEATHGEATPGEATHGEATPGEGPPSEASAPPLAATSLPRVGGGAKEGGGANERPPTILAEWYLKVIPSKKGESTIDTPSKKGGRAGLPSRSELLSVQVEGCKWEEGAHHAASHRPWHSTAIV